MSLLQYSWMIEYISLQIDYLISMVIYPHILNPTALYNMEIVKQLILSRKLQIWATSQATASLNGNLKLSRSLQIKHKDEEETYPKSMKKA